jgi:hypothetical protein
MNKGLFVLAILLLGSLAAAPNGEFEYISMKLWQADCMYMYVVGLGMYSPISEPFQDILLEMEDVYGDMEDCADAHDVACFREVYPEYVSLVNQARTAFLYIAYMYAYDEAGSLEEFLEIMEMFIDYYTHMNQELMLCYMD